MDHWEASTAYLSFWEFLFHTRLVRTYSENHHINFVLNSSITYHLPGIFLHWRWLAVILATPGAFFSLAILFVPETPRFLLMVGRREEANKALKFLRGVHV